MILEWKLGGEGRKRVEKTIMTLKSQLLPTVTLLKCTDPPAPIAARSGSSPNSLDDAMEAETRPVAQPQCAAHHDLPVMVEEKDIPPRPSRRLVCWVHCLLFPNQALPNTVPIRQVIAIR